MNKFVAWLLDTAKWVAVCTIIVAIMMAMFVFLPPAHAEDTGTITFLLDTKTYVTSADVAYIDNGVEVRDIQFEYCGIKGGWFEDNYRPGKTYIVKICGDEVIGAYENDLLVPGLIVLFGASAIGAIGGCLWAHRSNKREEERRFSK